MSCAHTMRVTGPGGSVMCADCGKITKKAPKPSQPPKAKPDASQWQGDHRERFFEPK